MDNMDMDNMDNMPPDMLNVSERVYQNPSIFGLNVPAAPRWSYHLWSNYFRRLPGKKPSHSLGKNHRTCNDSLHFCIQNHPELFLYVSILIRFDIAWWKFMVPPIPTTDWIYPTAPGGHCADAEDSGSWDSHEATWAVLIAMVTLIIHQWNCHELIVSPKNGSQLGQS